MFTVSQIVTNTETDADKYKIENILSGYEQ